MAEIKTDGIKEQTFFTRTRFKKIWFCLQNLIRCGNDNAFKLIIASDAFFQGKIPFLWLDIFGNNILSDTAVYSTMPGIGPQY